MEASAKDGEGAGRGPCGLRNSELGPRPHDLFIAIKTLAVSHSYGLILMFVLLVKIFLLMKNNVYAATNEISMMRMFDESLSR